MTVTRIRAKDGPLSRAEIVEAALGRLERGELETMTIRGLAAELGVAPMSLYRHVRNKDDLLLAVTDVLLDRLPPPASSDPATYLIESSNALRAMLVASPALLGVFHRQAVTSPAAKRRLERTVAVLESAGLSREAAVRAYAAVHIYTLGFCSLELGRREHEADAPPPDDAWSEAIRGFVGETQFDAGLRALVDGLVS